jgi:hypothetical protein
VAFGDTVKTGTGTGASGAASAAFGSGSAAAGNLLHLAISRSTAHSSGGAWGTPSGFTDLHQSAINTGNMAGAHWYKIAAGGETSAGPSGTNESGNWCAALSEIEGPFASGPLDVQAENETQLASASASVATGTTGATSQASTVAIAIACVDSGNNVASGRTWGSSFGEVVWASSGARAAVSVAKRVLSSTGAVSSTFSYTGTNDELYAAVAVFKEEAAGDPPSTPTWLTANQTVFSTQRPTLRFTATDPDADRLRHQVQISNNQNFAGGGINLTFEHNAGTGVVHPNATGGTVSNGTDADGNPQLDDRPGRTVPMGGGFLDHIDTLVGRDEEDTDGELLVRLHDTEGTPGTDGAPAGATNGAATPTPGWAAVSEVAPLDNTMAETPAWRSHNFTGANRIQTLSAAVMMPIVDWIPVATSPNTNTVTVQVGDCESGHNGWIDGNSANYGVQTFGPKIRIYEEQTLLDYLSGTDDVYTDVDDGGESDPFPSGHDIDVQPPEGDELEDGRTYYARVRSIDPDGSGVFSPWSDVLELAIDTSSSGLTGAHLASTALLFSGTVVVDVDGAHLASGAQLFSGTVAVDVGGAHLASGAQLFTGTVGLQLAGAHLTTSVQLFAGTVSADDSLAGAHLASTAQLFAGTLSLDLLGAHVTSTAQLFAGELALGLAGAHVTTTAQLFAGTLSLEVTGAHVASAAALFAGTVSAEGEVGGAHLGSALQLFAGSVTADGAIAGVHLASTAQLFAGTAALTLTGGHIPSGAALFAGDVGLQLVGAFVSSGVQLFAGIVHPPELGGATLLSGAVLFAGAIETGVTITEAHGRASYRDTVRGRGSYRDHARGRARF